MTSGVDDRCWRFSVWQLVKITYPDGQIEYIYLPVR